STILLSTHRSTPTCSMTRAARATPCCGRGHARTASEAPHTRWPRPVPGGAFTSPKYRSFDCRPTNTVLLAFALRPLAASLIVGNNEVDVTDAERARKFE